MVPTQTIYGWKLKEKNPALIGTFHQTSSNNQDKLTIDKTETVFAIIAISFDGTIVLTADTNINVKENIEISQRYTKILNSLNSEHM